MNSKCQKRDEHQVVEWRKIVYLFISVLPCHPHHLLLPVKSPSLGHFVVSRSRRSCQDSQPAGSDLLCNFV